jgi:hypothetical protein
MIFMSEEITTTLDALRAALDAVAGVDLTGQESAAVLGYCQDLHRLMAVSKVRWHTSFMWPLKVTCGRQRVLPLLLTGWRRHLVLLSSKLGLRSRSGSRSTPALS